MKKSFVTKLFSAIACWVLVFTGLLFPVASFAQLPEKVVSLLNGSPLSTEEASFWVSPVSGGEPILDFQADMPRNPASVAKILTTGTSLFALGENYRWKTEFYIGDEVRDGVLLGDLYIKGYGNPYMVEEALMDMVIKLRNLGLDKIEGDIILDNAYFENNVESPDSFDGHGLEPYNAIPNALAINFRTIELVFENRQGEISIHSEPALQYTKIQNKMTFNNKAKCNSRGFNPRVVVDRQQDLVIVTGSMSKKCKTQKIKKVLTDAGDLYYGIFKKLWQLTAGELSGGWYYGQVDTDASLFYTGYSRPLYEQIEAMNKYSNNVMTRQLFLTMGAELASPPSNLAKSRKVVLDKLRKLGVNTEGLTLDNGSGLSRDTQVTAKQLGTFLLSVYDSQMRGYFENSLSVVGVDGTLRRRLKGTPLQGNAIGKTGTLKDAKAVAGYLTAQSGEKYAYVMLFEGRHAKAGRGLQDQVMQWIYQH